MKQIVSFAQVHMISLVQICDYGDFVDGHCLTTTTASPETTTTAMAEDVGKIIIIWIQTELSVNHIIMMMMILN